MIYTHSQATIRLVWQPGGSPTGALGFVWEKGLRVQPEAEKKAQARCPAAASSSSPQTDLSCVLVPAMPPHCGLLLRPVPPQLAHPASTLHPKGQGTPPRTPTQLTTSGTPTRGRVRLQVQSRSSLRRATKSFLCPGQRIFKTSSLCHCLSLAYHLRLLAFFWKHPEPTYTHPHT